MSDDGSRMSVGRTSEITLDKLVKGDLISRTNAVKRRILARGLIGKPDDPRVLCHFWRLLYPFLSPLFFFSDPVLRSTSDRDLAGSHQLLNPKRAEQLDQRLDLLLVSRGFDGERHRRDIHDPGPENVRCSQDLGAVRGCGVHLHQDQLPLHVSLFGEVSDLDHIDELVKLFDHLLDDEVVPTHDQRHSRDGGVERLSYTERSDFFPPPPHKPPHSP